MYGERHETSGQFEQVADAGEPHVTRMKISPLIINMGISLLVMAFFAICLHS